MLEHEGAHLLTMDTERLDRRCPRADEIPHRFVTFVRNPHRGQLAGAQQPGKGNGVPAVRLHPIARFPWNQ